MATRTIEIEEGDLDIILEAIRRLRKHHFTCYKMTLNAGYGKATSKDKADFHKDMADKLDRIETNIAYSFI